MCEYCEKIDEESERYICYKNFGWCNSIFHLIKDKQDDEYTLHSFSSGGEQADSDTIYNCPMCGRKLDEEKA